MIAGTDMQAKVQQDQAAKKKGQEARAPSQLRPQPKPLNPERKCPNFKFCKKETTDGALLCESCVKANEVRKANECQHIDHYPRDKCTQERHEIFGHPPANGQRYCMNHKFEYDLREQDLGAILTFAKSHNVNAFHIVEWETGAEKHGHNSNWAKVFKAFKDSSPRVAQEQEEEKAKKRKLAQEEKSRIAQEKKAEKAKKRQVAQEQREEKAKKRKLAKDEKAMQQYAASSDARIAIIIANADPHKREKLRALWAKKRQKEAAAKKTPNEKCDELIAKLEAEFGKQ